MTVYILTPGNSTSGGPETLHQLAHTLNENNIECFTKYYGRKRNIPKHLSKYNIKEIDKIKDSKENIVICPETATQYLKLYPKSRKVVWWLSVDFYKLYTEMTNLNFKNYFKKLFYNKFSINFEKNNDYFHIYNCEYAKQFLLEKNVSLEKLYELCGPINTQYLKSDTEIKVGNIIAYNPKKGKEFTEKIIKDSEDKGYNFDFIPIENMDTNQVSELLDNAKMYIDFGNFPGPERLPREAVIKNCLILTCTEGAAKNDIDVPIKKEYKFDKKSKNISKIILKIDESINNYDEKIKDFEIYKQKVLSQVQTFEVDAVNLIKILR